MVDHAGRFSLSGEGLPSPMAHGQQSDMRSVQNLEAVINAGLRAALLEETPDQSLKVLLEHLGKALRYQLKDFQQTRVDSLQY